MKTVIVILLFGIYSTPLKAQDTAIIIINKIIRATSIKTTTNPEPVLTLKKSILKNVKQFTILVKSPWLNNASYKKELEIESDSSIVVPSSEKNPGNFDITKTAAGSKIRSGKKVKLYLLLNPANQRMMIPSRRIYLGSIAVK
jgi:hypothetical protein